MREDQADILINAVMSLDNTLQGLEDNTRTFSNANALDRIALSLETIAKANVGLQHILEAASKVHGEG